ncbi:60S ribosomal protein L35 [Pseudoloma neurophilia]|uniref:60S ribosomal protein L35 n=1 Tax=Pseudoloma neurophilia TaxID=146866 RepID=A0A0R0LYE6_9MICR|nr:60S ribosomal protein L35 [Pseudoloma neurophilia]
MLKLRASDLRLLTIEELETKYADVKTALLHVRQRMISSNATPVELHNCKRNISCVMTILREKRIEKIFKDCSIEKKKLPKELQTKKTKKMRQKLTNEQMKKSCNGRSKFYRKNRLVYAYMSQ